LDVAQGYQVETDLSRLIERRHDERVKSEGERLEEELWMESARRYHERQREQNRWEWVRYFDRMAESHAQLSESYRERAERLCEDQDDGETKRGEA
jgi:hypothetical protein